MPAPRQIRSKRCISAPLLPPGAGTARIRIAILCALRGIAAKVPAFGRNEGTAAAVPVAHRSRSRQASANRTAPPRTFNRFKGVEFETRNGVAKHLRSSCDSGVEMLAKRLCGIDGQAKGQQDALGSATGSVRSLIPAQSPSHNVNVTCKLGYNHANPMNMGRAAKSAGMNFLSFSGIGDVSSHFQISSKGSRSAPGGNAIMRYKRFKAAENSCGLPLRTSVPVPIFRSIFFALHRFVRRVLQ
jgi:hypothetical protein